MALFWPEARLAIILSDSPAPAAGASDWPEDVLVLHACPSQVRDEEFLARARHLLLARTHYLSGCGQPPERLDEPAERALIRLVVRGESHVALEGEHTRPSEGATEGTPSELRRDGR